MDYAGCMTVVKGRISSVQKIQEMVEGGNSDEIFVKR